MRQVLVLGLEGAGKSSVLHYISSEAAKDRTAPTQGFNSVQVYAEGFQIDLLERKSGPGLPCWGQGRPLATEWGAFKLVRRAGPPGESMLRASLPRNYLRLHACLVTSC